MFYNGRWKVEKEEVSDRQTNELDGMDNETDFDLKLPETNPQMNIIDHLKQYKEYLRGSSHGCEFRKEKIFQFYNYLDGNDEIRNLDDIFILSDEFNDLEEQWSKLSHQNLKDDSFTFFYKSLAKKMEVHINALEEVHESSETKRILRYLYTAILTKINFLNDDSNLNMVIDVGKYMQIVKQNFDLLKNLSDKKSKVEMINQYKNDFKKQLDQNIDEAKEFIDNQIRPEINGIINQVDETIDFLLQEIIETKEQVNEHKEELLAKKKDLKRALIIRGICGSLKIVGTIAGYIVPVGSAVGAVNVVESLAIGNQTDSHNLTIQNDHLKDLTKKLENIRSMKKNHLDEIVDYKLKEIEQYENEEFSNEFQDTKLVLNNIKDKLETGSNVEIEKIDDDLRTLFKKKQDDLFLNAKVMGQQKFGKASKIVENGRQLLSMGFEIFEKFKADKDRFDLVKDAIGETDSKIEQLKQFENEINLTFYPMLEKMSNDLNDVVISLDGKSKVSLDITKWKVQSSLKNIRSELKQITEGFKTENKLNRCFDLLEEAMILMINIYDRIRSYQEQQNLANYIANISSDSTTSNDFTEPKLNEISQKLEYVVRSNLALKQYQIALNAFNQWVFPFAKLFGKKIKLPDQLNLEKNFENLIKQAMDEMEMMKFQIDEYNTSIQRHDEFISSCEFNSNYVSTKPFFVWKNEDYKGMISDLLDGKEVALKSRIEDSIKNKDAIKFNWIEINFKTKNASLQTEINNKLKAFRMKAKHMGNSNYRVNDKFYLINTPSQTIEYSFEKNENNEPLDQNYVYTKMKNGDLILSPYALWKFSLVSLTDEVLFKDLEIYKNEIDLELNGHGNYIPSGLNITRMAFNLRKGAKNNDLEMDKFYKSDDLLVSTSNESDEFKDLFINDVYNQKIHNWIVHRTSRNDQLDNLKLDSNGQNGLKTVVRDTLGMNSNLLLGQLIVGKIYGANKNLNDQIYLSPDQKRQIKINEMTRTILPALKKRF